MTTSNDGRDVDFDALAEEQIETNEPDQLDGPAWDLDRRLDGTDATPT
jgi:hypothetical protein